MSDDLIYGIIALVIAMVLHECGHAAAAFALGDTTARDQGRLTLNPLKHVDPVGTILLPGVLLLTHAPFLFGWAKPVPISAAALHWGEYRNPRRLMALVALAGPATNLLLAVVGGLLLYTSLPPDFVFTFMVLNLVIALFNLLPVPPFDGGRIAVGVLPLPLARAWARMERFGVAVVFLLIFVLPAALAQTGTQFDPFGSTMGVVLPWAETAILVLTGHNVGNY
jgi:Zn-dependent protease